MLGTAKSCCPDLLASALSPGLFHTWLGTIHHTLDRWAGPDAALPDAPSSAKYQQFGNILRYRSIQHQLIFSLADMLMEEIGPG